MAQYGQPPQYGQLQGILLDVAYARNGEPCIFYFPVPGPKGLSGALTLATDVTDGVAGGPLLFPTDMRA